MELKEVKKEINNNIKNIIKLVKKTIKMILLSNNYKEDKLLENNRNLSKYARNEYINYIFPFLNYSDTIRFIKEIESNNMRKATINMAYIVKFYKKMNTMNRKIF